MELILRIKGAINSHTKVQWDAVVAVRQGELQASAPYLPHLTPHSPPHTLDTFGDILRYKW
jgi:hypothetical protein